jgi:uncharacterized RDD family membrane protein YckC
MLIDERFEVETPEGAMLSLSLAGPVTRAMAYGIDLILRLIIFAVLAIVLSLLGKMGIGLLLIIGFAPDGLPPTLFDARRHGPTPDQTAMGSAVVHANGSPLSFNGSLIRNLLRTADAFPLFYLLGFVTTLISPRYQRLGDMAANTLVVHIEKTETTSTQHNGPANPPDWPLSSQDQLALLAFHERQGQFSEARQQELAQLAFPELSPPQALQRLRSVTRYLIEGAQ